MAEAGKQSREDVADLPEGFKMTELGPLPEEWEVVNLGRVFVPVKKKERSVRIEVGQVYRTLTVKLYGRGITLRQEIEGDKIGTAILYRTEPNDFVFSKIDARNGAWGFVPEELSGGLVSSDFPILQLIDTLADRDFIALSLSRPNTWEPLRDIAVGTTNRRRIQVQQLLRITIPLPPLPEQRAIAHVLRAVQRAKEATERVIQATRELKKSLMRHLFTYGPVPIEEAERVPLKETEIGSVPEHWEITVLGKVIIQAQYGLSLRGSIHHGKYPILRMNNLQNGTVNICDLQYVDLDEELLSRFKLNKGDLLFNRTNSHELVGKTALFNLSGTYVFASYLIRIVPDASILDSGFLNYYLNNESTQARLKLLASRGVSQSNISATKLKTFQIPLPPLPEQHEIVRILQAVDKKLQAEEARKQALEALFKTLLHNLMTGKIRVNNIALPETTEVK